MASQDKKIALRDAHAGRYYDEVIGRPWHIQVESSNRGSLSEEFKLNSSN